MREWLNSQVAAGYVVYYSESGTYELPAEQALVLADAESPVFMPPAWDVAATRAEGVILCGDAARLDGQVGDYEALRDLLRRGTDGRRWPWGSRC